MRSVSEFALALLGLLMILVPAATAQQQQPSIQFEKAGRLFAAKKYDEALQLIRSLDLRENLDDDLKKDIRWAHISALTALAKTARQQEDWARAYKFSKQSVDVLEDSGDEYSGPFLDQLTARRFWSYKNMVLACHGLEKSREAKLYRDKLYTAYSEKKLPNGLDQSFNFDFYRTAGQNVWGYEYFPQLGDPSTKGSFTKFLYHVYEANEDGSDKAVLYRLHVLKFHKINEDDKGDYVLALRRVVDGQERSETLYEYLYDEPVEIEKLRRDIRQVVKKRSSATDNSEGNANKRAP